MDLFSTNKHRLPSFLQFVLLFELVVVFPSALLAAAASTAAASAVERNGTY